MRVKRWIIAGLAAAIALTLVAGVVVAQTRTAQPTAEVQLRLWEHEDDASRNWISIRPHGGPWLPATTPLLFDDGHTPDGRYRLARVVIESPVPEPVPAGVRITDTSCYRGQFNAFLTLHGAIENASDATIREVTVTAALRDRTGVEVAQGSAVVLHGISPWGKREFAINFYTAAGTRGTCHVLALEYRAAAGHETLAEAPR